MGPAARIGVLRAGFSALASSLLALPTLFGLGGCAHTLAPRGGPPDTMPPVLIAVRPDSLSVQPGFRGKVRFEFDESISEQGIREAVTLYPFEGRPDVDKGGESLEVKPRAGWVQDRIYHIHIASLLVDLFRNPIPRPIRYVFSTGATLPENRVHGTVFDRITGDPVVTSGRVDMLSGVGEAGGAGRGDTLRYGAEADTAGRFLLERLPPGEYLAIGYEDANGNRRADGFDRPDTARVTLGPTDTVELNFHVFRHDTIGPQLTGFEPLDSLTLELQFSAYLDPDVPLADTSVRVLQLPDSTPLPLDTLLHGWAYPDWRERQRAAAAAAADTTGDAAPPDTVTPTPPRAPPAGPAPVDTAAPVPRPERRLVVVAADPLAPGRYLVSVRDIVSLSGLRGGGEVVYEREPEQDQEEGEDGSG